MKPGSMLIIVVGGGHSALSSLYGMGADNVLEWEVVDGTGTLRTASMTQNSDLYWAVTGGGGGTYGIVASVTVKLHTDSLMTGVQLQFSLDPKNPASFSRLVSKYHGLVPKITSGPYYGMGIALITKDSFSLTPLTLPGVSTDDALDLLAPLIGQLKEDQVAHDLNIMQYPNWLEYWQKMIKPNPTQLVQNGQYGGWMVPRTVLDEQASELQAAIQDVTNAGCTFVSLSLNVSMTAGASQSKAGGHYERNAVLPAWREAAMSIILST